jgi:hypothetical protein
MRCFPDIVDEVVIAMRGFTWETHTLNHITGLRPSAWMQNEALAVATAAKVKCREAKESYVPCTSKCFCCQLAHAPMITEVRAVNANYHDCMNATGSLEASLGPEQRRTMRCMARTSHRNNTAEKKRA